VTAALAVTLVAREGESERVAAGLRTLQAASRAEPGCRIWIAHRAPDDTRRFFLYELYDDDAALAAHRASPHFGVYAATIGPLLTSRDPVAYQPLPAADD
jgi:quinol monooxygenase YgiN